MSARPSAATKPRAPRRSPRPVAEPAKRWERRGDKRPGELVEAALRLFSERGFAATRLDDVAVAAGVTKGTVYLYFKSKEELFAAVARAAAFPRIEELTTLLDTFEGSTESLLRTLFRSARGALDGSLGSIIKLVMAESANFPVLARTWSEVATERLMVLVERLVKRGVARGDLRPVASEHVAPLLMAPILMLALWTRTLGPHSKRQLQPRAILAAHLEIMMRGLAPTASRRRSSRKKP